MQPRTRAYLQIHTAVLLYGLTGIFGDLIDLPKPTLVWWRMGLTVLSFVLWPGNLRAVVQLPAKALLRMAGVGCLVALHWVTFFGAIALTNASVTLAMLATGSFFTALFEPLIRRTKFKPFELILGLGIVPGVALVVGTTDFEVSGILVALFSSAVAVVFSILNKDLVGKYNPITMTTVELGTGFLAMSLVLPFVYGADPAANFVPSGWDCLYLAILAFGCTSFAYVITLRALQVLPTFAINLSINLEPVYTMVIAYFVLDDAAELSTGFYIGAAIILATVFVHPILSKRVDNEELGIQN